MRGNIFSRFETTNHIKQIKRAIIAQAEVDTGAWDPETQPPSLSSCLSHYISQGTFSEPCLVEEASVLESGRYVALS